jgi:flagellar biosynthesis protein FlhB
MADADSDKTEEPTGKRLGEAREKGQVGKSREVDHWFMLLAITLVIFIFGPKMGSNLKDTLIVFIAQTNQIPVDQNALQGLFWNLAGKIALTLAPSIALLMVAGIGSGFLQHGFLFSPQKLMPQWSRLSFGSGFQRLFSWSALVEFAKGALKLAILSAFCYWLLKGDFDQLEKYIFLEPGQILALVDKLALKLLAGFLSMLAFIAALDFLYQKFSLMRSLRMTREEVREESKQSEGDPMIKGRLRQLRIQRARQRMMQAVPKADVVITNPTHFAVALKYDTAKMTAPQLVAKGQDLVAKRIRDVAIEHNVPIVENPPLARALYANVDLDQEIPPEHYKPVAEVIGYVMRLRRGHAGPPPKPGSGPQPPTAPRPQPRGARR